MLNWLRNKFETHIEPKLERFAIMQTMVATLPKSFENEKRLKEYCDLLELQHIKICEDFQKIFPDAKNVTASEVSKNTICIRDFWAIQNYNLFAGRIVYIRSNKGWYCYLNNAGKKYINSIVDKNEFFLKSHTYENFVTDTYYNLA